MATFWEWVASSDATTVITTIIGPTGVIAGIWSVVRWVTREKPPKPEQERAVQKVSAPPEEQTNVDLNRSAIRILGRMQDDLDRESAARKATDEKVKQLQEERERDSERIRCLQEEREHDSEQIRCLQGQLNAFVSWGQRLHDRWDEVRANPIPPKLPVWEQRGK